MTMLNWGMNAHLLGENMNLVFLPIPATLRLSQEIS